MIASTRALVLAASALTTLGTLTACSGSSSQPPAVTSTAVTGVAAPPNQSTYVAMMPGDGDASVAVSVAVDGDHVVAYANNGADDEAWFFGTKNGDTIDLTSQWQDRFTASFDATELDGTLTMNDVDYSGTAMPAAAPAGVYTATDGDSRASWVVMPDRSMVGVMSPNAKQEALDLERLKVDEAEAAMRQRMMRMMRKDRQMMKAPAMAYGTWTVDMRDSKTTATPVVATTKQLPMTD